MYVYNLLLLTYVACMYVFACILLFLSIEKETEIQFLIYNNAMQCNDYAFEMITVEQMRERAAYESVQNIGAEKW